MLAVVALLILAAIAVVEVGRLVRDARRARRLNAATHELRRPLQSIELALAGADPEAAAACLEQARAALADLDAALNGRRRPARLVPVRIADVAGALERRWRFAAVEVQGPGPRLRAVADAGRLGAALDNLVANALGHGSGAVRVRAVGTGGAARFEVRDAGPECSSRVAADRSDSKRDPGDPRHGHGLGVVDMTAAVHGGIARPPRRERDGSTVASLAIPARQADP